MKYLSQQEAIDIDVLLMTAPGFSLDQLMELAGLSVAAAVFKEYPPLPDRASRVLIVAGPGNNGGDGLVAARHLYHFGYSPTVVYPKPVVKPLLVGLAAQLEQLDVPMFTVLPELTGWDVIIDGIFGFSFDPRNGIRAPFDQIIQSLATAPRSIPIVSIDIPSGWHVELGDVSGAGLIPHMLVSLTAPKLCAAKFDGIHYLGGRFVPPSLSAKYMLSLPAYSGTEQCVRL